MPPSVSPSVPTKEKKSIRRQRLDDRIAQRNPLLTLPAPPLQEQKAQQRDIVVPGNRFFASGQNDRGRTTEKIARHPKYADIQETADQQSKQPRQRRFYMTRKPASSPPPW
jgi:hypothetical protein